MHEPTYPASPSRALLLLLVMAVPGLGQGGVMTTYGVGDFIVGLRNQASPGPSYRRVQTVQGTNLDEALVGFVRIPQVPEAVDIDSATGDLISLDVGASGGAIEVWRSKIVGFSNVTDQTLLGTLPGSENATPVYLHRERNGGFLALTRTTGNVQRIYRLGISLGGMIVRDLGAVRQANGQDYTLSITGICSNDFGEVFVTSPLDTHVRQVPYLGGPFVGAGFDVSSIAPFALDADFMGAPSVGGTGALGGNAPYLCQLSGPIATDPEIVDIHFEVMMDGFMVASNAAPQPRMVRISTDCTFGPTPFWDAPAGFEFAKVCKFERDGRYGFSSMRTTMGWLPRLRETAAPTVGVSWSLLIDNANHGGAAQEVVFLIGLSEEMGALGSLPLDLDPLGFSECAQWSSWDASVSVPLPSGFAALTIPILPNPALVDTKIYAQCTLVDQPTPGNASGLITTNAVVAVIR